MWLQVLMIALLLVIMPTVQAQPFQTVYCGDLSADDCSLLRDAQESLFALHSARVDTALMSTTFPGRDGGQDAEMVFSVQGAVSSFRFQGADMWQTLNADVTATLQMRGFAETMPVSTSPPVAIPEESSAELRLVDGMLYVNFDTLEPPLEDGTLVGWGRYPLAARLDRPAPQATPEASPVPALSTGQDVNHLLETFDEQTLREFLSVSRTDDVFETRMNFAAMYAHPTVQAVVREQLQARFDRFGNPLQITDQHMAHLADQMAQVFPEPVVLQSLTVDPDWRVVRGFSIWGMWDFNIMMEAALRGDVTGWGLATTEVRVEVSEYNQIEPILAPEVSHPVDAETLARIPPLAWVLPSNGQAAEDLSE